MSAPIRVTEVGPFDLGWPQYAIPGAAFVDNFHLRPAQARARHDLKLAGFRPVATRAVRYLVGESLYWSVLVINEGRTSRELTLSVEAEGGNASVWVQHPWYTHGRALLPEARRYLVPELLLKHDHIRTPADLFERVAGLPDHTDPAAPVRVQLPPGGFVKCLIKVRTEAEALRGELRADSKPIFRFSATSVPAPVPTTDATWLGLYYGLLPGSTSPRYRISEALFERDLAYMQEIGLNTLVIPVESLSAEHFARLARHGIRRVVMRTDQPAHVRQAIAMGQAVGVEVLFYTEDEPHASSSALAEHLRRAIAVHDGGGRTFAAVSAALDARPSVAKTLDVPNTALWSLPAGETAAKQALRGVYYWQCAFERPIVNRYLAGLFCHYLDARGMVPFVYRDGFPQHEWGSVFEDDLSPLYHREMRQHMMSYPGRTGPLRTIQAEAFHQGLCDWRVYAALRQAFPKGFDLLRRQLSPVLSRTLEPEVLQSLYNGRKAPTLTAGPVDMRLLAGARDKALDLLAHAKARTTRFEGAPEAIERLAVRYDPKAGTLEATPAGVEVTNFPLCLIEGFAEDATSEEIGQALFNMPLERVRDWTLRSGPSRETPRTALK